MHTDRTYPQHDVPHIPKRHLSWFIQLLMVLAVLIVAGVIYGFWQTATIPMPSSEPQSLPAQGADNPPPPPSNEQSQTGSRSP